MVTARRGWPLATLCTGTDQLHQRVEQEKPGPGGDDDDPGLAAGIPRNGPVGRALDSVGEFRSSGSTVMLDAISPSIVCNVVRAAMMTSFRASAVAFT